MVVELAEHRAVERGRGRQHDRQGIGLHIGYAKFVMKVRAGRETGLADVADDIALAGPRTSAKAVGEAAKVSVPGRVLALMAQNDDFAVAMLNAPANRK